MLIYYARKYPKASLRQEVSEIVHKCISQSDIRKYRKAASLLSYFALMQDDRIVAEVAKFES